MPFRIQRVPQGLNPMLSLSGGNTPVELEERVRPTLDLTQLYGLQQIQVFTAVNGAAAEAADVTAALPAVWCMLFSCHATIVKTATMTALRGELFLNLGGSGQGCIAAQELGPFGATETGVVRVPYVSPFPRLLPPNSSVSARAVIIGTDATANVSVNVVVGIFG